MRHPSHMYRMRPLQILVSIIGFAAATVAGVTAQGAPPAQTAAPAQPKSAIIEKIIVKVNGEVLTQSELEREQIETLQQQQNAKIVDPKQLATDAGLSKAIQDITPQLLVDAIDELLIVQYGRELGVKFTETSFQQALDNIKKQNKMDDKQLAAAIKESNLTLDQLRQNFERKYIRQTVERQEIMKNMTLTEEETRQYYKAHPEEFMKPPTVTLREILVTVPTETVGGQQGFNAAKDEEAKEKIIALRARAMKGEEFSTLVTEASEAPTKANGGLVGPMLVEDLSPAVSAAVAKLKPGEITDPLRLGNGYRIFKLETRTAAEVEAFDKLRGEISNRIYESRLGAETEKFLAKLRTQALIEWKDDTYKKIYEQARAQKEKSGL
jgi:peptidyl-prolyl cis-trans isomerase SurA